VGSTFGLLAALVLGAPVRPINLNLPPPALPPPQPAWSNFRLQAPKPTSRPAWLPPSVLPDLKRAAPNARGSGHDQDVNPYLGGDRSQTDDRGNNRGVRR
jgi:hypothetical protein